MSVYNEGRVSKTLERHCWVDDAEIDGPRACVWDDPEESPGCCDIAQGGTARDDCKYWRPDLSPGDAFDPCPTCASLKAENEAMREVVGAARAYMIARHRWSDRPSAETARMLAQSRREMDDALDRLDAITKEKP